jgi:hypothetical protein
MRGPGLRHVQHQIATMHDKDIWIVLFSSAVLDTNACDLCLVVGLFLRSGREDGRLLISTKRGSICLEALDGRTCHRNICIRLLDSGVTDHGGSFYRGHLDRHRSDATGSWRIFCDKFLYLPGVHEGTARRAVQVPPRPQAYWGVDAPIVEVRVVVLAHTFDVVMVGDRSALRLQL